MPGFGYERCHCLYGGRRPDALASRVIVQSSLMRSVLVVTTSVLALLATVFFIAWSATDFARGLSNAKPPPATMLPPTFVGSNACGDCHHEELKRWIGSHHPLSFQTAGAARGPCHFSGG